MSLMEYSRLWSAQAVEPLIERRSHCNGGHFWTIDCVVRCAAVPKRKRPLELGSFASPTTQLLLHQDDYLLITPCSS